MLIAVILATNNTLSQKLYVILGVASDKTVSDDYIRFLDVGQGDSILLCSNGKSALIDASTENYGDAICSSLHTLGVKYLDLLMISHNHDDHYGGAERITERFMVDNLIIPDITHTDSNTKTMKRIMSNVLAEDGECFTAVQGMSSKVGDISITVLGYFADESDENDRSIFAIAEIDGIKFLFTGDAGKSAEHRLLTERLSLDCDVLKVGHHGSKDSSTELFLNMCRPEYAVISCGKNNQYSHPDDEALQRLEDCGAEIFRTDISSDITFYVDDGEITVQTKK